MAGHSGFFRGNGRKVDSQAGIVRSIASVLDKAGWCGSRIGHVNADGSSMIDADRIEAKAINDSLGETPVTAPKSYFGSLGAGTGAVELAVSVMAITAGVIPPTLNYEQPDPHCPVNVVRDEPMEARNASAIILNQTPFGQAASVLLASDDE
jgi:3-oxoacyl-[acyl-carrier-protein] synthase II